MEASPEVSEAAGPLEGVISIEAALRGGNRKVFSIVVDGEHLPRGFSRVKELAAETSIPITYGNGDDVAKLARGKHHGGVVAEAGERVYVSLETLVRAKGETLLCLLDGVEDPFNFGQAIRSLYAAGATGLILRPRNWMSAAGIVARSSAGASELIAAAIVGDLAELTEVCERESIEIILLDGESPRSIFEHDLTHPSLLVIGGEQRGVTRIFRKKAHSRVSIPYGRSERYSLGTAASASIAAFEVMRQRAKVIENSPS